MPIMLERVVRQLRRLAGGPACAQQSDRQLLEQFAAGRDEAFAELVRRHGPLVLAACKRLLPHQDAEDAFQATFVVLARKAGSVRWQDSVSHWLYQVACRVAMKLRSQSNLRQRHERQAGMLSEPVSEASEKRVSWQDAQAALDEELSRLPAKFRAPLVLCYLEGKSRDEAARELGRSEGAVKGMLERGRALLRDRLARRGLSLSAGLLGALSVSSAAAAVPAGLSHATVQAACTGSLSVPVAALSEGVIRAMFLTKLKIAAAVLVTVGLATTGVGVAAHRALSEQVVPTAAVAEPASPPAVDPFADVYAMLDEVVAAQDAGEKKKPAEDNPDLVGRVKEVGPDGIRFVIVLPPKNKGDEPPTVEFKLVAGAKVSYFGVAEADQKPKVGYIALVWLAPNSQDAATAIRLGLKDANAAAETKPDLAGKVAAVAADQKAITVELFNKKDGQTSQHPIKLTDTTKVSFVNVADGGKVPTVGYHVRVWLANGSQDTAAGLVFAGSEKPIKKPASEKTDPNAKPKPEKPDPNAKPKPEKPDPNAKPKPEKPDPNAKPKPEKPDPNPKPKPEKAGADRAPDYRLTLPIGATKPLQLSTKEPIKEVINEKDSVARVSPVVGDPTRVLVTGLSFGVTRVTLIGVNGTKETYGPNR